MLKRFTILAVFCSASVSVPIAAQERGSLFRYIALSPRDTITLGQPFTSTALAIQVSPKLYQLKPGTFGGAERIRIHVGTAGRVISLEFQYADGARFNDMLVEYNDWLGAPTGADSTARRQTVVWQDARTRFELSVNRVGDREFVTTQMIDVEKR